MHAEKHQGTSPRVYVQRGLHRQNLLNSQLDLMGRKLRQHQCCEAPSNWNQSCPVTVGDEEMWALEVEARNRILACPLSCRLLASRPVLLILSSYQ